MDFVRMAEELMLDIDDFMPLVRLFLEVTTEDLERLAQAYRVQDLAAAAAAAHSIRGAAANLGFDSVATTAAEIEKLVRLGDPSFILAGSETIQERLAEIRHEL